MLLVVDDHGDPTIRCGLHAVAIGVTPTSAQSSPSLSLDGPAGQLPLHHLVPLFSSRGRQTPPSAVVSEPSPPCPLPPRTWSCTHRNYQAPRANLLSTPPH